MKLFWIITGIFIFILMFIGMHEECPMGHHEIDCDVDLDLNKTNKKEK